MPSAGLALHKWDNVFYSGIYAMKKITLTSLSIASAMSAGSAMAADFSWSGFYGGLSVGYQDAQLHGTGPTPSYYGLPTNPDPASPTGGAFVGYNFPVSNTKFVAGVEASLDIGGAPEDIGPSTTGATGSYAHSRVRGALGMKVKAGYEVGGKFLPYLQAGPVAARTSYSITNGTDFTGSNKNSVGWGGGFGVDYAISPLMFAKVSYFYTRLPDEHYLFGAQDEHFTLNDFKIGIGYKF